MNLFKIKFIVLGVLIIYLLETNYSHIFQRLKKKNLINKIQMNLIVSLTASQKSIQSLIIDRLIKSILNQTILPYKILLIINKKYKTYISQYLKLLINNNFIDVISVNKDFKHLNKYFYIPNRYKKNIIVVVDDNFILEKDAIENLIKSYKMNPNSISARRVYKMNFNNNWNLQPFNLWTKDYKKEKFPKFYLFAIHGAGTLYPPNTLNFNNDFIFFFQKIINADDFLIKYFELKENLKTVYVDNKNEFSPLDINIYEKYNELLTISPNEYQLKEDFRKRFNLSIYKNIIKEKVLISNDIKEYFSTTINKNIVNNHTLLVSMTSYPVRINGVYEVFISLLNQSADLSSYQCFLTLAREEFTNGEKDLPRDLQKLIINGWVKLIWYHNIYSHKKLIPILKIYPENDIIIIYFSREEIMPLQKILKYSH